MSTLEEQFQLIDERIAQAKENLRNLHAQRNSLLLICRLPHEVLGLILAICFGESDPDSSSRFQVNPLRVTHVCRHWRAVALGCPAIWDTPDFTRPALAREMLARAKSVPLYIQAGIHSDGNGRLLEILKDALQDMTRVAKIAIRSSVPSISHLLAELVRPAPMLSSLSIINERYNTRYVSSVVLRDDFLAGNTPCLRELSLQNCVLQWGHMTKTLSGLRSLMLRGGESNRIPHSDFKAFLQVLQTMQALRSLELLDVFPCGDSITADTLTTLPKLEYVKVVGSVTGCVSLLNFVTFPSKAFLDIGSVMSAGDSRKASHILTRLIDITEHYAESAYICARNGHFVLRIFESDDHKEFSQPSRASPRLTFELTGRRLLPPAEIDDFTKHTLEILPLTRLSVVHVVVGDRILAEDYTQYFGSLTKLHTMSVEGSCGYSFIQGFCSSTFTQPPGFLSLRTIVLQHMDFESPLDGGAAVGARFLNALRHRSSTGDAIHCVSIKTCSNFSIEQLADLKEVVGEVDWDGYYVDSDGEERGYYDSQDSDY